MKLMPLSLHIIDIVPVKVCANTTPSASNQLTMACSCTHRGLRDEKSAIGVQCWVS